MRSQAVSACALLTAIVAVPVKICADDDVRRLINNPFNQPGLIAQQAASGSGGVLPGWSNALRAVLVAGPNSLVNLDGNLLEIGDMHEGYSLIRVSEGSATFRKDGHEIVVKMSNDNDEDDE